MRSKIIFSFVTISCTPLQSNCFVQHNEYKSWSYGCLLSSKFMQNTVDRKQRNKKHSLKKCRARWPSSIVSPRLHAITRLKKRPLPDTNMHPTSSIAIQRHDAGEALSLKYSHSIPPWIPDYVRLNDKTNSANPFVHEKVDPIVAAYAQQNLNNLRAALENHVRVIQSADDVYLNTHTQDMIKNPSDVDDIIDAVVMACANAPRLIAGAAEFLSLLLSIDEVYHERKVSYATYSQSKFIFNPTKHFSIVSKNAMIAASYHYVDCIVAREEGIYDIVRNTMRGSKSDVFLLPLSDNKNTEIVDGTNETLSGSLIAERQKDRLNTKLALSDDVIEIIEAAARIKQIEIMADTIRSDVTSSVVPSKDEAAALRGLLLTATDGWRSLMIRCVASLYRIKGISIRQGVISSNLVPRGSLDYPINEVVRITREALYVYAPLAQRLGLYRLKNEIENNAFNILYRRQYHLAQSLFMEHGASLNAVTDFLSESVSEIMLKDPFLAEELESFRVESRVKQPYSLWKKLIRQRLRKNRRSQFVTLDLSVTNILDCIALRVILRLPSNDNPDHEKMVCYYVSKLLREVFHVQDAKRIKDYLSTPKSNGYMSIHFTSTIHRFGVNWPFEIQIRTEDMHHIAEFGQAAHWDYKLQSGSSIDRSVMVPTSAYSQTNGSAYIESFLASRDTMKRNQIFFFLSPSDSPLEGRIISMPKHSTVRDTLEFISQLLLDDSSAVQSPLSDEIILINGNPVVSLDETINNGDILTVPSIGHSLPIYH